VKVIFHAGEGANAEVVPPRRTQEDPGTWRRWCQGAGAEVRIATVGRQTWRGTAAFLMRSSSSLGASGWRRSWGGLRAEIAMEQAKLEEYLKIQAPAGVATTTRTWGRKDLHL